MSWNLLSFEPELVIERLLSREAAGREQRCPPPPLRGATGTRVATLPQPRLPQEETRCPYLMEAVECSETVLKKERKKDKQDPCKYDAEKSLPDKGEL